MDELQSVGWAQEEAQEQTQAPIADGRDSRGALRVDGEAGMKGGERKRGALSSVKLIGDASKSEESGQDRGQGDETSSGPGFSGRSDADASRTHGCFRFSTGHLKLERYAKYHVE